MKNDFFDDNWLKEELSDEYIHDDDFSFSVVKKLRRIESRSKRNFYILLAVMIGIITFLFIPDLMMIYAEDSPSLSLLGSATQQKTPSTAIEFVGLAVIFLSFILIWSFEDFDLI